MAWLCSSLMNMFPFLLFLYSLYDGDPIVDEVQWQHKTHWLPVEDSYYFKHMLSPNKTSKAIAK